MWAVVMVAEQCTTFYNDFNIKLATGQILVLTKSIGLT